MNEDIKKYLLFRRSQKNNYIKELPFYLGMILLIISSLMLVLNYLGVASRLVSYSYLLLLLGICLYLFYLKHE